MLREVGLFEPARLQHRHRQRVAHHQHRGGAGGRREIERARFLGHPHIQDDIAVSGDGRFGRSGQADDFDRKPLQRGN